MKKKPRIVKRILSVALAAALVTTSVQIAAIPSHVVLAAPGNIETGVPLGDTNVKDQNVLTFYKIIANAVEKNKQEALAYIDEHTAQDVIGSYGSDSDYTENVSGTYLSEYEGKINFGTMKVTSMEGMGWAQSASEIDLSGVSLSNGSAIVSVPAKEFQSCKGLKKIILPSTVRTIEEGAFDKCSSLETLGIGTAVDGVVALDQVTLIGNSAFSECISIQKVEFGKFDSRLTKLELKAKAFVGCTALSEIEIPIKDAEKIGASVFENCANLQTIGLHNDIQYIGSSVFKGAGSGTSGVKFYIIEDGITDISCLPRAITYIDEYAFQDCYLKKLDLSNCKKLTKINKSAFTGAKFRSGDDFKTEDATADEIAKVYEQYTVVLPDTLQTIGQEAFRSSGISYIEIPESCTNIEEKAFEESRLFSVKLPKTLEVIKDRTFARCYVLDGEAIEIPSDSQLKEIKKQAFTECYFLYTTAFLKDLKNLKTIGENAFAGCCAYLKVGTSTQSNAWGENILISGLKEVILPDSVTELGNGAFKNNYYMQTAVLGKGITNIPDECFQNTDAGKSKGAKLEKVILSEKLVSIGDNAFANQLKLNTISYKEDADEGTMEFADGLTSIGDNAFMNCGASYQIGVSSVRIMIPKDKVYTSYAAGRNEYLVQQAGEKNSEHVYISAEDIIDPQTATEEQKNDENIRTYYVFAQMKYYPSSDILRGLYVTTPKGYVAKNVFTGFYDTTQKQYEDRLAGNKLTTTIYLKQDEQTKSPLIYTVPTANCEGIFTPIDVADMGIDSKNNASASINYIFGAEKLILPDSLKDDNLGKASFKNCVNLTEVTLPKALTKVQDETFSGCGTMFTNVSGSNKLYDYYGLRKINMPNTLTEIGASAFKDCKNLILENPKGVGSSFGTGIEKIGDNAFSGCVSLDEVVFPSSLISIGRSAFANCTEKEDNDVIAATYADSGQQIKFRPNRENYGTKTIKKGLNVVDFERAGSLESIGSNAFEQTNIVNFDLSKTKVKNIESSLLSQCTFLKTVTFSNLTENMAENVMKDDVSLTKITAPISSTMKGKTVSGVYGTIEGRFTDYVSNNPTLVLVQPEGEVQPVPINREYELNINAINKDTLYGDPTIYVIDGNTRQEIYSIKDGVENKSSYRGLSAKVTMDNTGKYHFSVTGTEYIDRKNPVTLRIQFATGLQFMNTSAYWQSSQQIDYKVSVADVITEKVSLSAAEDSVVKNNPVMYEEKSEKEKVLYLSSGGQVLTNGITLTAQIEPAETTEGYSWESSNPGLVEVVADSQKFEDGKATVTIKRVDAKANGTATITVRSGAKSAALTVVCQTSASSFDNEAKNKGDNLPDTLNNTSSSNPYVIPNGNGGKDQLGAKLNFPEGTDPSSQESLIFVSSNPDIISVDNMGNLTTKKASDEVVEISVIGQASGIRKKFYFLVTDDQTVKASGIEITGTEKVNIGESISLTANVKPINAGNKEVTWKVSSGTAAISIDENGVVTGLSKGTAKVIAISKENENVKSKEFTIKVLAPTKSIRILDGQITLEEGKTYSIARTTDESSKKGYVVTPNNTDDKVEWKSSNENILSVTMSGNRVDLKTVAVGTVTLTATATSGVSASIQVNVTPKKVNVTGISITKEVTLNVGQTHTLTPTVLPANANEAVTYTYSTNNAKVATVDANGVIRAVGPGTATITAKTNTNRYAGCTVTVKQPAKSIRIYLNKPNVKKVYMAKGQTLSIKAEKNPLTSTDTLSYKTNKKKVAVVSTSGMITAKKKGTAKITIQASSGKKATITVVVSKKEVKAKKVKVKGPSKMKRKQTKKLTVSLVKAKSTDTISFSSSNPAIASVDAYGNVKAIKKGKVKITVQASSGKKAVKKIKIK